MKFSLLRPLSVQSLTVLIVLLAVLSVRAGENEDFRFAEKLKRDGMYMAAGEEYLRFAERYPRSVHRPRALMGAGEAFMQA